MNDHQAIADKATTEVMQHFVANISGLELRAKIKETIAIAMGRAAPTEPAVDRDALHNARLTLIRASGDEDLIEAVKIGKVSIHAALLRVLGAAPAVPQKPYLSHFATLNEYKAAQAVYEAAIAPPSPSVDQAKRLVGGEVAGSAEFVNVPVDAYLWLMGAHDDAFEKVGAGNYWWRSEFNRRAKLDMMAIIRQDRDRASTGSATSTDNGAG